jgi:serine/threonine protein kinase
VTIRSLLDAALAGHYAIEREIGRGGMATVYLARDLRHDRAVALKVLDPELAAVLGVDRFLSEIRDAAGADSTMIAVESQRARASEGSRSSGLMAIRHLQKHDCSLAMSGRIGMTMNPSAP